MKKLLLSLALVFGMVATASAEGIGLGGKAAFILSTWKGDDCGAAPWGAGFNAGVAGKIGINQMISVTPEAGISLRRVADDEVTFSTWNIEVPVLARINVMPMLYLEAGIYLGIHLADDFDVDEPAFDDDWGDDWDDDDWALDDDDWDLDEPTNGGMGDYNTIDFGLVFGVGYSIMPNLDAYFRAQIGLTNLFEEVDVILYTLEFDIQHMNLAWGVTYWFM